MPLKGEFGSLQIFSIGRMPSDHNFLSLDASLAISTRVLCFEASWRQRPGRSDRPLGGSTGLGGRTSLSSLRP
jgi:hypothetical protein